MIIINHRIGIAREDWHGIEEKIMQGIHIALYYLNLLQLFFFLTHIGIIRCIVIAIVSSRGAIFNAIDRHGVW